MPEQRKMSRRHFSDYLRVMNETTGELVGHLADISTGGFKLECKNPIAKDLDFILRMDATNDVAGRDHLVFAARSRWCQKDPHDPMIFNVGFQITKIAPEDVDILVRIFEKYGTDAKTPKKDQDYWWR